MNSKHKPTPWEVEDNRIIQRFYNESWNKQIPVSYDDEVIGKFNSCDQAELAVRAVNAHEELVQMLTHLDSWLRDSFFDKDAEKCRSKADDIRQAIAKAEGR